MREVQKSWSKKEERKRYKVENDSRRKLKIKKEEKRKRPVMTLMTDNVVLDQIQSFYKKRCTQLSARICGIVLHSARSLLNCSCSHLDDRLKLDFHEEREIAQWLI